MRQLKLGTKIGFGFGLLILITVLLGGITAWKMINVRDEVVRLDEEFVPEVDIASEIERNALTTMMNIRSYTYSENTSYLEEGRK